MTTRRDALSLLGIGSMAGIAGGFASHVRTQPPPHHHATGSGGSSNRPPDEIPAARTQPPAATDTLPAYKPVRTLNG